jgi:hypothetical protein
MINATFSGRGKTRVVNWFLTVLAFLFITTTDVMAQSQYVTPDGEGDITFTPGLHLHRELVFKLDTSTMK